MLYSLYMRKLDDIIPPSRRREVEPMSKESLQSATRPVDPPPKFPYKMMLIIVAVIAVSVGALFYFSSAKVEVIPNAVSAAVQGSFTASQSTGVLPYEIITAEKIASQAVKGSGTKTVNSSASGTITIYNTQAKAQKLVTNTRFATTAGLIFRTHTAVTVPAGTTAKPGSVNVKVYADKVGDAYNVGATSFTIPGFAGTPQVTQVFARSSAPMSGGASGSVPVVDAVAESQARATLVNALAPDLIASLKAKIPPGYILLSGAATTTYQALASAPSGTTGMVDVKEQGTATAVVFPNSALAKAIATSVSGLVYGGEPVTLSSTDGIILTAPSGMPVPNASSFSFTLSGKAPIIYTIDPMRIAAAVSGKTLSAAEVALTNYPEVKRAIIILRPFWRQTLPQDPASISVVVAKP